MMIVLFELIIWILTGFFSVGIIGINYLYTQKMASSNWKIEKNPLYLPKVSIIIPTFNEEKIIGYKIKNLMKVEYPINLVEYIFVDSLSSDSTMNIIREITSLYSDKKIQILTDIDKKGKSNALNFALKYCNNEIIIVSDADCFWQKNTLITALSYFYDKKIGAVTAPKRLLNNESTWVTRSEDRYLKSMNLIKLGDSKTGSTIFFEGGLSAFRRELVDKFDPYSTGSDDCGTVITILEKNYRAIMISETEFFTTFPETFKEKIDIKIRRSVQLWQIYRRYLSDLIYNKIKISRSIIIKNIFLFFFGPFIFMIFSFLTLLVFLKIPLFSLLLLIMFIPMVREYSFELIFNYSIFFFSLLTLISRKRFLVWEKPGDRELFTEKSLIEKNLI